MEVMIFHALSRMFRMSIDFPLPHADCKLRLAESFHCDHTAPKLTQNDDLKASESYLTVSMIALLPLCVSAFEQRVL